MLKIAPFRIGVAPRAAAGPAVGGGDPAVRVRVPPPPVQVRDRKRPRKWQHSAKRKGGAAADRVGLGHGGFQNSSSDGRAGAGAGGDSQRESLKRGRDLGSILVQGNAELEGMYREEWDDEGFRAAAQMADLDKWLSHVIAMRRTEAARAAGGGSENGTGDRNAGGRSGNGAGNRNKSGNSAVQGQAGVAGAGGGEGGATRQPADMPQVDVGTGLGRCGAGGRSWDGATGGCAGDANASGIAAGGGSRGIELHEIREKLLQVIRVIHDWIGLGFRV